MRASWLVIVLVVVIAIVGTGLGCRSSSPSSSSSSSSAGSVSDAPHLQVTTRFDASSAQAVANVVTTPLEDAFRRLPHLVRSSSVTTRSRSTIDLVFDNATTDIDADAAAVAAAISETRRMLPDDLPAPPSYRKVMPPVARYLVVNGDGVAVLLRSWPELVRKLEGVTDVELRGLREAHLGVTLDGPRLASSGQTTTEVIAALAARPLSVGELGTLGIGSVHLRDIASITDDERSEPDASLATMACPASSSSCGDPRQRCRTWRR